MQAAGSIFATASTTGEVDDNDAMNFGYLMSQLASMAEAMHYLQDAADGELTPRGLEEH